MTDDRGLAERCQSSVSGLAGLPCLTHHSSLITHHSSLSLPLRLITSGVPVIYFERNGLKYRKVRLEAAGVVSGRLALDCGRGTAKPLSDLSSELSIITGRMEWDGET